MQHKPIIFVNVDKIIINFDKNLIYRLLCSLKTQFHIVYIVGHSIQKFIKCHNLSQYLIKKSNTQEDYSCPNCVIFIKQINSLIGHYSIKLDLYDEDHQHRHHREKTKKKLNVHVNYLSYRILWVNYDKILREIYNSHLNYVRNIIDPHPKSVIVFDLDETIIDQDYRLVCTYVRKVLQESRNIFDYMVLWSHGTTSHVQKAISLYKLNKLFDLVLTRGRFQSECFNKGFGFVLKHLNKIYGISKVNLSVLVDDQDTNFNNDYNYFLKVNDKIDDNEYKKNFTILKKCINEKYGKCTDKIKIQLID